MVLESLFTISVVTSYFIALCNEMYFYGIVILIASIFLVFVYDYYKTVKKEIRKRTFLIDEYIHYNHMDLDEYLSAMEDDVMVCDICGKNYWKDCKKRCKC